MISVDTNLFVHAANLSMSSNAAARQFLASLVSRNDLVLCELMLVELYLKLRNPIIFPAPLNAAAAVAYCQALRGNTQWQVVESAPIMPEVWRLAARRDFAFRRIIDARLALTLRHYSVTEFATTNVKDFQDFGFTRVWNPLVESPH